MGVYYIGSIPCSGGDIYHFGRKGQKWGKHIFGKIAEFFTGNTTRSQLNAANKRINESNKRLKEWQLYRRNDRNRGKQARIMGDDRAYRNSKFMEGIDKIAIGSENSYRDKDMKARDKAQADYDKTLPGMMAKAREKVSKAYSDAASALSGKGLDIQSFYSQVMQKAQGTINQGKQMISKFGGQFVDQIQTVGKDALNGGKRFLLSIIGKVKGKKNSNSENVKLTDYGGAYLTSGGKTREKDREREGNNKVGNKFWEADLNSPRATLYDDKNTYYLNRIYSGEADPSYISETITNNAYQMNPRRRESKHKK